MYGVWTANRKGNKNAQRREHDGQPKMDPPQERKRTDTSVGAQHVDATFSLNQPTPEQISRSLKR